MAVQASEDASPLLHPLFQDRMVLQRDQPIRIWGRAAAGEQVRVELMGVHASGQADGDGRWEVLLPSRGAGGPHVLRVESAGRVQQVEDVLVGDVWLCAGQSNMELPVWRTLDSRAEIAAAGNDRIRLLTVPQVASAVPLDAFAEPVEWRAVSPDSVRDFSAACYYFARELQKTVDVPMGLVSAAWGGSRIQAWMSADAMRAIGGEDEALGVLALYSQDPVAAAARWGTAWARWWNARPHAVAGDEPWQPGHVADATRGWRDAPRQLGAWERWDVPELAAYDGMVWYRTTIELGAGQVAHDAVLELGPADEMDVTWVNGIAVGSTYGAGDAREYRLPQGLLVEGENVVVVNVLDTWREGGLSGPADAHAIRFADGTRMPLDAGWRFRVAANEPSPPRAPWQSAAGLTTLHNGMIAPLGGYALRGALWYQGESNTFEADRYAALLRALRADWRERFDPVLAFIVVQLADFGMPASQPVESGWAALREAQRQVAMDDDASALTVAIDIGDRYDIHPPNKQELARRLARAARHVAYGGHESPSGPVPVSAAREGDAVIVRFGGVGGHLRALGGQAPIGFELCAADAGSCRYATAEIRGHDVLLRAPVVNAVRVRHGWADGPVVTLFDETGLPAGPFELPIPLR
ncbi:MAG: sialate O-acetylesterase [Luteimonas sp.]|nr:sialate O-acetylesterase [Luteimonas sp.]